MPKLLTKVIVEKLLVMNGKGPIVPSMVRVIINNDNEIAKAKIVIMEKLSELLPGLHDMRGEATDNILRINNSELTISFISRNPQIIMIGRAIREALDEASIKNVIKNHNVI